MGRPDPCVLFAQSFVHSQLGEYVDEVLFAEPVVVTTCEFLEQNASPCAPTISLIGATSPPSFALEVFVQCEGEPRFRRLCPAFLYSHSSSNFLEVEAVVTNHLVVRGSYRSLTLVVYGNTAEDLGQFNIEFDLDSSLVNLVCSPSEEKLDDLPPAFYSTNLRFVESLSSLKSLSLPVPELDLSDEMKAFLQLTLKICEMSDYEDTVSKVVHAVVSAVSSYVSGGYHGTTYSWDPDKKTGQSIKDHQQVLNVLARARNELLELFKHHQPALESETHNSNEEENFLEPKVELVTSEQLVYMYNRCTVFSERGPAFGHFLISQNETTLLQLGIVLLLCSSRESCFHFVSSGGLEQIVHMLCHEIRRSAASLLMLLGVIEHATRHAIGCEGFLGWWPREDEIVPVGKSDGYSHLLSLLLQKQRHDVASSATYLLHRLRSYEIASRYESAVLSVLGNLSSGCSVAVDMSRSLLTANSMLKTFLKLLTFHGTVEDSSPLTFAQTSIIGQEEGLLSYKATVDFIASSNYNFTTLDIDTHLLSLLKERGFLPLSAAFLSSPVLRSANDSTMEIFVDIAASIELILLSLLRCRSGLTFLLLQPETMAALVLSLKGIEDLNKADCLTLREATLLISKGFFCHSEEVGMITELHLRVVHAIDRLLATTTYSEEQLWLLWDLCAISRSDSGRQALLVIGRFPEVVSVLLETLRSFKDSEPIVLNSGSSPLSLVVFHCAAEILEVLVTDSTASSLSSWIGHAVELHKALHSSSPGSNRRDAPTRLLEWIDAGVVYHKNGATGLLRYAAILASGGDAQLTSATVLVSESMDAENVVGDSTSSSDSQIVDNLLGKLVADKYFDGVTLRNTSVVQLTTAFRILAFISENSAVAASLYEEGAVTLIYVVLVNCKVMLERSSNNYDYLVDEGAECNSTSDLLFERNHEQSLVDLLVPSLVLLINLLKKLQEAKEQYRNTKLLNALLKLHREISPKVAACAADMPLPYPVSVLGLHAVCRLLVSALACWPSFGWAPGLFHCLLESVQATSLLALGPKDACSLLSLLGDLFPEEGIWSWKDEMPTLSALRSLSIGTIMGPQGESYVDWYLKPDYQAVLFGRLRQQLDKISQIVLQFSFSALEVIQDMLRAFIVRIACQRNEFAVDLLRPVISWMRTHIFETSLSETNVFKVYRLLNFVVSLLEHPHSKTLLLKEGIGQILVKALDRCCEAADLDRKQIADGTFQVKNAISMLSWSLPAFKSLSIIFYSETSIDHTGLFHEQNIENLSTEDSSLVWRRLLKLCQVLPVGRELLACLVALKELASNGFGRRSLLSMFIQITSTSDEVLEQDGRNDNIDPSEYDWRWSPPLLNCLRKLLRYLDSKDGASVFIVEAIHALSLGALCLCREDKTLEGLKMLKFLFGLPYDLVDPVPKEKLKDVHDMIAMVDQRIISENETRETILDQVKESVTKLLLELQRPACLSSKGDDVVSSEVSVSPSSNTPEATALQLFEPPTTTTSMDDAAVSFFTDVWKSIGDAEKADSFSLGGLSDKFMWDCPDSSSDRLMAPSLPVKRKLSSTEGSNRRSRDNTGFETVASNAFSRGTGAPSTSSGPSRRDTFRQRKPNTSRPPSMHVDDYVARERNVEGVSSSLNVVGSSQRGGSTSGRPPSIHVDEFMARQRERQNPMAATVGDVAQVRNTPQESGNDPEKSDTPRQLRADLDDDLHEIDIVFDEESESDDRLPFPQPDDNLQPAPVITGESSPGSIVEESEGDVNGDSRSEFPSRTSVSRPDSATAPEVNALSEKNNSRANMNKSFFHEHSDESKYASPVPGSRGLDKSPTTNANRGSLNLYNLPSSSSSVQPVADSRLPPYNFYMRDSQQKPPTTSSTASSQGYYEQKVPVNQPPLPPMPPPAVSSVLSQSVEPIQRHSSPYVQPARDLQPPLPSGYPLQVYDTSASSNAAVVHIQSEAVLSSSSSYMASLPITQPILDSKHSWATVSSGSRLRETYSSSTSARPLPPLPPMPPPFSTAPMSQSSINSGSQSSFSSSQLPLHSTLLSDPRLGMFSGSGSSPTSFTLSPFTTPLLLARPSSNHGALLGSPTQQQVLNPPSLSPHTPSPLSTIQSIQTHPPPPPPPPQLPRPPHLSQHLRQPLQVSQTQPEQMVSLQQGSIQVQPIQVPQQLQIPQIHVYYQSQQQDSLQQGPQPLLEQTHSLNLNGQADNVTQQHQDSGLALQKYFSSPEAIQSLLSDRDKLCQLLEQHPKLMQMLQERLGQL